jgi:colanic acid biosynthesis glycosyl transferase WcaI
MIGSSLLRDALHVSERVALQADLVGRQSHRAVGSRWKQIIFINRFFYPDYSATSQLLSDLASHLSATGHPVRVITSRQRYDDPEADLPKHESWNGISIDRISTTRFGRNGVAGRGLDYLSFYASVWRTILATAEPGALLVAKTDPPLLSIPALHAVRRRGLHLVNWLQDLYPEIAAEFGMPFMAGRLSRGLAKLRDATLREAVANVVVGERMAKMVRGCGINPERVHVIPNWCDDEAICPLEHDLNPLRREWGLEGRFVVGYSGNLGRGHEFRTVLDAAERLRDDSNIVFVMIGGGKGFPELTEQIQRRNLDSSFRFFPYQERAVLEYSLGLPDIHWLSLKPELEGLIVPSKFYGIAAAGRPIISVGARDGEIAQLVERHGCGLVVEPGGSELLATELRRLAKSPARVAEMGSCARKMLERHFTRRRAFACWDKLLDSGLR